MFLLAGVLRELFKQMPRQVVAGYEHTRYFDKQPVYVWAKILKVKEN